jgi:hypothetical protein
MANSISFWRVLVSVHSPFWWVFEKNGFPHCWYTTSNNLVITSICNETIFHLIVKSTLAKLCRVGIVFLIFLLTEMKCHDSWHYCIVYLVFVGEFKKKVTRQTWRTLFHFGEYLFQSTRHFGECLKKMVSHTAFVKYIVCLTLHT